MKMISLKINNFRQFYGEQVIEFSTNLDRNVTVIRGENGSGKTTLLNSFKWLFYGITDFDTRNEKLLNERLVAESPEGENMEMKVEIDFEHEDIVYHASRVQNFVKELGLSYQEKNKSSDFVLTYVDENGAHCHSNNSENHMNQILPQNLHSYFFFNGERIEKLAHANSSGDVQTAIKNLMGLEIVARACSHIDKAVVKNLKKELKEFSSDDLSEIIEKENHVGEQLEEIENKISLLNDNINEHTEEYNLVNQKLAGMQETSQLQKERAKLEEEIVIINSNKEGLVRDQRDYISRFGFLAFTKELVDTSNKFLEDKRMRGELPFKVKEQFICDLLEEKTCICGRELVEGSDPFSQVQKYRSSTTSSDIESAFITASGSISHIRQARNELFNKLRAFQKRKSEMLGSISTMEGKIDLISSRIGEVEVEDIKKLENKRGELIKFQERFNIEKGGFQLKKRELMKELEELKSEREKLETKSEKEDSAKERLQLAEEAYRVISALYTSLGNKVRIELSKKVNQTFKDIIRKNFWAEISDEYTLDIYKRVGEHDQMVYDKSTGENQVTSLSFIGSIVEMAKERHRGGTSYFKGGIYPIVMDSAYGPLDPEYRQKVAEYIPKMSEQVILMVSDSHWFGEVENEIRPRMGKEFSLVYYAPNPKSINERVKKSETYEYTDIREGFYA
jgi:DNA sulfur modification protein DndD